MNTHTTPTPCTHTDAPDSTAPSTPLFPTVDVDLSYEQQCQLVDLFAQKSLSAPSFQTYQVRRTAFLQQGADPQQARERALFYACLNQSIEHILIQAIDERQSSL